MTLSTLDTRRHQVLRPKSLAETMRPYKAGCDYSDSADMASSRTFPSAEPSCLVHRIDCQEADGVDAVGLHLSQSANNRKHNGARSRF